MPTGMLELQVGFVAALIVDHHHSRDGRAAGNVEGEKTLGRRR